VTAIVAAVAVAVAPSFVFGREGGNIVPLQAKIYRGGRVVVDGRPGRRLTRAKVTSLLRLAAAERFARLPRRIECAGTLPDIATLYVKVGAARTVTEHGSCNRRFDRVYAALAKAVGAQ
jgi:hypothetical protein